MSRSKALWVPGARGLASFAAAIVGLAAVACSTGAGLDPEVDDGPGDGPSVWGPEAIQVPFSEAALRSGTLGGRAIHCSGPLWNPSEYEDYVTAFADRPPAMWVVYYSLLDSRFTPAEKLAVFEAQLTEYGGIPFLGISYTKSNPDGSSTGWDPQVAAGDFDAEIREIARAVAADARPLFVRPGFEFNGIWNNYQPATYREAFIRIRALFLAEGATNTIWVWNAHPAGNVAPFMNFYPGDENVDWWGVNLFGKAFESASQQEFIAAFVEGAQARGKPLIIPESIPHKFYLLDNPTTWNAWFVPYFDLIQTKGIGAFCYSNRDYTKIPAWSDWGDLRIEQSPLKDEWAGMLGRSWVVNGGG
jgi:hypothetical protein